MSVNALKLKRPNGNELKCLNKVNYNNHFNLNDYLVKIYDNFDYINCDIMQRTTI